MKTVAVLRHQSLFDIALQHCGNADRALDIANLNGLALDTVIQADNLTLYVPTVHPGTGRTLHPIPIIPITGIGGFVNETIDLTRRSRLRDILGRGLRVRTSENSVGEQGYISIIEGEPMPEMQQSSASANVTESIPLYSKPINTL